MAQSIGAARYRSAAQNNAIAVQGFSQLTRALQKIEDGIYPELRQKLKEIGNTVALVAAANAPRRTGELQLSIKSSVTTANASVYSSAVYGGAINYGAYPHLGPQARGPHINRANASHYMDRAVTELSPWVEQETNAVIDWLIETFEKEG